MSHPGGTPHVGESTGGGLDGPTRSDRDNALGASLGGGRPGGARHPEGGADTRDEEEQGAPGS